jgi:Glycosyl transferase family 90
MNIIDSQASSQNWRGVFREFDEKYPWESKENKIIWRGALSEAEWRDALISVRWRVNKMVTDYNLQGSTIYNVGLTGIPRWLTTRVKFNITEVGGFLPSISPMTSFMNYKAILDMDGNSWSSRFGTLLCYNSVVVKVEPKYFEYFFPELKPWKHYIPVKNDLSDFDKNIRWALSPTNEKAVRDIIESANDWCSRRFLPDELARDQLDIWETYVREMNRGGADWEKQLASAKTTVFARSTFNVTNIAPGLELKL